MVGLSFTYSGGACGVATTNREIRRPEDLKGLKVGVYGDKVNEAWVKSLGAAPVALEHRPNGPLQFARDGSLDSVVITWRNFQRANLEQDFKYFNLMDSSYLVSVTYINEKFFESLPEAYRTLIKEASRSTGRIERAKTIELNENAKQAMLAKGVYPVYLTEANKLRLLQALRPAYDHSIDELIGKNLIERIKNTQDAPDQPSMASDVVSR